MSSPSSPRHVFMSYSRRDEMIMRRVAEFLRKQDINVWVDNERLVPGTPIWEVEIEKAIRGAGAVVVLLSPNSNASIWVRREISFSERFQKRIFPLLIAGDEDTSIMLRLATSQYVDIRQNEELALNSLSTALSFYLEDLEAQEQKAREEAERLAREKDANQEAERKAAAREKAEREATEKAMIRHKAEREVSEKIAREKDNREFAEKAAKEKTEREGAEKGYLESASRSITRKKHLANFVQLFQSGPYLKWILVTGAFVIGSIFIISRISNNLIPFEPTQVSITTTASPLTGVPSSTSALSTKAPLKIGTPEHPIRILFVPSVDANVIVSGGEIMAQALNEATGLTFEVSVPTSYAATVEEICTSPTDTMAFIPAIGYVVADNLCGADVAFKAIRFGQSAHWSMFVVARDSNIQVLQDLEGLTWAYPDAGSTSGYMIPQFVLNEAGVTPGETIEAGGHPQAVRAVYTGEADFATAFYRPWAAPEGAEAWERGIDPDLPINIINTCDLSGDGNQLLCDGYRVLDARANIREEFPDVVQQVRILQLSPDIPNDTLSFSHEFPEDLRAQIEEALLEFAETEAWSQSIGSEDFYDWSGLQPTKDGDYDIIRSVVTLSGITIESLR